MSSSQHLHHKIESLRRDLAAARSTADSLRNKRDYFTQAWAIEANIPNKFQLEQQIKGIAVELEAADRRVAELAMQLDELKQQLEQLSRNDRSGRVYRELLTMNHKIQALKFRQITSNRGIGAFLIHGAPADGPLWMVRRLLNTMSDLTTTSLFRIDFKSPFIPKDIQAVRHELSKYLAAASPDKSEIIQRVNERLRTQPLILICQNIDALSEEIVSDLITEFWQPLAVAVQQAREPKSQFHLLMFLVGDSLTGTWNLPFDDVLPDTLIRLTLGNFSEQDLTDWMGHRAIEAIPANLIENIDSASLNDKFSGIARDILTHTKGGPEEVASKICNLCQCDYQGEDIWLRQVHQSRAGRTLHL